MKLNLDEGMAGAVLCRTFVNKYLPLAKIINQFIIYGERDSLFYIFVTINRSCYFTSRAAASMFE